MAKDQKKAKNKVEKKKEKKVEKEEQETIVNIISNEINASVHIEFWLDARKLKRAGFVKRAITREELKDMLMAEPTEIYPAVVIEFHRNLNPTMLKTKVSCTNPKTRRSYQVTVDLKKLIKKPLKLRDTGQEVEEASHNIYIAELMQYTFDSKIKFEKDEEKTKLTNCS